MYWIFLIIFIIAVLIPDIIRGDVLFLSETRSEEIAIFLMGATGFIIFMKNERMLSLQRKEKEKDRKKINQTVKDLVESYSYIGEVNRKMDILMNVALGLSERSALNRAREKEIYESIISAANFLMKADLAFLRFVNVKSGKTEKEINPEQGAGGAVKNSDLIGMSDDLHVKKFNGCLVVSSSQNTADVKGYIIIRGYDSEEEETPKNLEILKVFATQALFLYSYTHNRQAGKDNSN